MTIIHLCHVFKRLCAKVVDPTTKLGELKKKVVITLMLLKRKFFPLLHIMTYMLVHLVEELELCGPIHTQCAYHIEWYLKTLKGVVQNRMKPKGSMEKIHAQEKVVQSYTKYLVDFTFTRCMVWDEKLNPFMFDEVFEGGGCPQTMIIDL